MDPLTTRSRRAGTSTSAELGETSERSIQVRARVLLVAALGPIVTCYAAVAALFALVSAIAPNARFSAADTLLGAGPGLLAVYQVPVEINGSPLGVLPLLPTIAACALVSRTAGGAAQRLGYREPGQSIVVVGAIACAHALCGALIALLSSGAPLRVVPLSALLIPAILSGVSAGVGVAGRCGVASAVRRVLNPLAMRGLRAGALGIAALCTVGALISTISLLAAAPVAHDLFAGGTPGFGSGLGMLILSVAYVPNAVVACLSLASGPGFAIGGLAVSPFGYTASQLPGIPLLAAVPESYAGWWPLLLLLPAAAGALVGWSVRDAAQGALARMRIICIAGALVALAAVLLATLAGGRLGGGALDPVDIPAGLFSLACFGWIVLPGAAVAWFTGPHPAMRFARAPAEPGELTEDADGAADIEDAEDADDVEEQDLFDEDVSAADGESDPDEVAEDDLLEGSPDERDPDEQDPDEDSECAESGATDEADSTDEPASEEPADSEAVEWDLDADDQDQGLER